MKTVNRLFKHKVINISIKKNYKMNKNENVKLMYVLLFNVPHLFDFVFSLEEIIIGQTF